jgi:hypothetical protein
MLKSRLQSRYWTRPLPALVQPAAILLKAVPRDDVVARVPRPLQEERNATTYFEWLFLQPIEKIQPKPIPAVIRRATR